MADRHLVGSYSLTSFRHAILVDDGYTGILYLHSPTDDSRTVGHVDATCFAFNRVEPIPLDEVRNHRPAPPPISVGYASVVAVCHKPEAEAWELSWSADGMAVVLLRNGTPWAFVSVTECRGLTKAVAKRGPWGKPWSAEAYHTHKWGGEAKRVF